MQEDEEEEQPEEIDLTPDRRSVPPKLKYHLAANTFYMLSNLCDTFSTFWESFAHLIATYGTYECRKREARLMRQELEELKQL